VSTEKERRKDMKARGKLNAQWDRRMKKANKKAKRQQARQNVGCAVVAALVVMASGVATVRGWL